MEIKLQQIAEHTRSARFNGAAESATNVHAFFLRDYFNKTKNNHHSRVDHLLRWFISHTFHEKYDDWIEFFERFHLSIRSWSFFSFGTDKFIQNLFFIPFFLRQKNILHSQSSFFFQKLKSKYLYYLFNLRINKRKYKIEKTKQTPTNFQQEINQIKQNKTQKSKNGTKSIQKLLSFKLVPIHWIRPESEMKQNKTK